MTDSEQTKDPNGIVILLFVVLGFHIVEDVLSLWLARPLAGGAAILIVFPFLYPIWRSRVTLTRWLLFTALLAVLDAALDYGTPYFLCGYEWGAVAYGMTFGALVLTLRFLWMSFLGEPGGSYRIWMLVAICIALLVGTIFYVSPGVFCG